MGVKLVVNSAKIKCAQCDDEGELTIPPISGILVTGQWVASKYDVLVPINIKPFRHCKKRLQIEGIDVCFPERIMQWENTKDDINILGDIPAITDKSYAICFYQGYNKITITESGQGLVEVDEILYWEIPSLEELLKNPDFIAFCQSKELMGKFDPTDTSPSGGLARLKYLWEYCEQQSKDMGITVDPRMFLSILRAEGTGSLNTKASKSGGGAVAEPDFKKDLRVALENMLGKIYAYPIYKDAYNEIAALYQTETIGGHKAFIGGFYEYMHYTLPGFKSQDGNPRAWMSYMYSSGATWNGTVQQFMGELLHISGYGIDRDKYEVAMDYSDYIGRVPPFENEETVERKRKEATENFGRYQIRNDAGEYTDTIMDLSGYKNLPSDLNGYKHEGYWDFTITHIYVKGEGGNYGNRNTGQKPFN